LAADIGKRENVARQAEAVTSSRSTKGRKIVELGRELLLLRLLAAAVAAGIGKFSAFWTCPDVICAIVSRSPRVKIIPG
jgi:hypothetical protein